MPSIPGSLEKRRVKGHKVKRSSEVWVNVGMYAYSGSGKQNSEEPLDLGTRLNHDMNSAASFVVDLFTAISYSLLREKPISSSNSSFFPRSNPSTTTTINITITNHYLFYLPFIGVGSRFLPTGPKTLAVKGQSLK